MEATYHTTAAVMQMEMINNELPAVSKIPGLHFVERDGCRLFPQYNPYNGTVDRYIAVMVAGDETAIPTDAGADEEPFTDGRGMIGVAIILKPVSETAGKSEVVGSFSRQIATAIEKLQQHVKDKTA